MNVCVLGLAFFIVVSTLRGTTCKKVKRGMYTSGELFFVFFLCMTEKCIRWIGITLFNCPQYVSRFANNVQTSHPAQFWKKRFWGHRLV